ncbi:MAG: antitoxin [Spirochaetes bacterium]|nr:antitoxin [Spirochaetota bacterium]
MSTLTIRTSDENLAKALKRASIERKESVNQLVLETLAERFIGPAKRRKYTDLDHLAGTWSAEEYDQFTKAISSLEAIHPGDWA